MTSRRSVVLVLPWLLLAAAPVSAQNARYVGYAAASVTGEGGTDVVQAGRTIPDAVCDEGLPECFDQIGVATRTLGGAFEPAPEPCTAHPADLPPRPGFPRVESCASGALIPLGPIQILFGGSAVIADSRSGRLESRTNASLIRTPNGDIPLQAGETMDLGIVTITAGREHRASDDGLSLLTVDGLVVQFVGQPEQIFGRTTAGLELPFTTGGGGCNAAGDGGSGDVGTAAALLTLTGIAAQLRKRRG